MSATDNNTGRAVYQPFQCHVCQRRFTRQENLKRHAALHSRTSAVASLTCNICQTTFSRPDLRLRHMKRQHPDHEERKAATRQRSSPTAMQGMVEGAHSASPLDELNGAQWHSGTHAEGDLDADNDIWSPPIQHEQPRTYPNNSVYHTNHSRSVPTSIEGDDINIAAGLSSQRASIAHSTTSGQSRRNVADLDQSLLFETSFQEPAHRYDLQHLTARSPSATFDANITNIDSSPHTLDKLWSNESPQFHDDWSPSTSQCTRGFGLFFTHISPFVPFLHGPTTTSNNTPRHLLLSILCLAYQYGEDPDCNDEADSGSSLSINCFHRARALVKATEEDTDNSPNNLSMVQACLLLQVCAMMYLCGKYSAYGLKLHARMISLARAGALMQPLQQASSTTQDLDSLWQDFITTESRKRTAFAVHQIDALWYQFLSVPRSVSHLEIKHDLPCPADYWTATTAAGWAFQRLVAGHSSVSMPYPEVIRCFLSRDAKLDSIPPFDPYGGINITQFLISSGREASGWASITGMLSMERLDPLRTSLVALRPYVQSKDEAATTSRGTVCEATWETAMIELQMWSLSHTGGIVEGSMDAMVHQSTYLASSCESLCDSNAAESLKPHIDWFLQYLDAEFVPVSEAPWVVLYAYKAFLIAWQLVRDGFSGAMEVVGVSDGDERSAVMWARRAFENRQQWQLSRLIVACLDQLDK